MEATIKYPALRFRDNEPELYAYKNRKEFSVVYSKLTEEGYFNGMQVIDSLGRHYRIIRANKIGWGTFLMGYHPLFKGRLIKVEFELEFLEELSLAEVKDIASQYVGRSKKLLEPYVGGEGWVLATIHSKTSIKEVIELFY